MGEASDGFADRTWDGLPLSPALSLELTACGAAGSSSLPQAQSMAHKDVTISAPAKRLRKEAAVGVDTTDME
jgi:hypothetical protein